MKIPVILVGNRLNTNLRNERTVSTDSAPRVDYVELAKRLGAELIGHDSFDASWYRWIGPIERRAKIDVIESLYTMRRLSKYNLVYSTSEKMAIPLAALLALTNQDIPHLVFAHKLSSGLKSYLFTLLPLYKNFGHIISDCTTQTKYAINHLGMPDAKVDFVHHAVDQRFYRPLDVAENGYILAVGQEQRDYKTLLQAVSAAKVKLVIVASSSWSTNRVHLDEIGETTVVSNISYQELRTLYAGARLVVVPLFNVDYAAGNTTLLEAMAMAKPVIVSGTSGIQDYVVHNETAICVPPMSSEELLDAILFLLNRPHDRKRLGTNARQAVEECMNLDIQVRRIAQIAHSTLNEARNTHG